MKRFILGRSGAGSRGSAAILRLIIAGAIFFAIMLGRAEAATYSWTGPSGGSWSAGANWSTGAVPTTGDNAVLGETGTATSALMDATYSGAGLNSMTINSTNVNFFTLDQFSGTMIVSGTEIISDSIYGNEYLQNGGTNNAGSIIIGNQAGSSYSNNSQNNYTLLSGTMSVGNLTVGNAGDGSFDQFGGAATVTSSLVIAAAANIDSSSYLLSGGTLTLASGADIIVGESGAGAFVQTVGTVSGTGAYLYVGEYGGSNGTYSLQGGTLSTDLEVIGFGNASGNTANFIQTNGTNILSAGGGVLTGYLAASTGTYSLDGGVMTFGNGGVLEVAGSGTGLFVQNAGAVTGNSGTLFVGTYAGSAGTYDMGGGTLSMLGEVIGDQNAAGNTALFAQSGGTNTVLASGSMVLGSFASSSGTYALSGTGTLVLQSNATLLLGNNGAGIFNQSGGTVSGSGAEILIGIAGGSSGTYNLSGGSLTAEDEYMGYANASGNTAIIIQTGGTNTLLDTTFISMDLGALAGANGSYTLSNGSLVLSSSTVLAVGDGGKGTFTQTGGLVSANGATFLIGNQGGSNGTYSLSGSGMLMASFEYIGYANTAGDTALFTQTGGSNTILTSGSLVLGSFAASSGTYALSGSGVLALNNESNLLVGDNGAGTFNQSGGAVTSSGFAQVIVGQAAGSSGTYNLSGGTLSAYNEVIGYTNASSDTALLAQTGGTNTVVNGIILADDSSSSGSYTLSGSGVIMLTSGEAIFDGYQGTGIFTQTGGAVAGSTSFVLYVGVHAGSSGTYKLSGGSLTAGTEYIGFSNVNGTALFAQSGGTNTIAASGGLYLGVNVESTGTYTLSGSGGLTLGSGAQLIVGDQGAGVFTQNGGVVSATNATVVVGGTVGSSGTYSLSGGALMAATEYIGESNTTGNTALFAQTGGINTILTSGSLVLGNLVASTGTYTLSGTGALVLDNESQLVVGDVGAGTFTQSGGAVTSNGLVVVVVVVGRAAGSSGTYNLNGGLLSPFNEYIGESNTTGNIALLAQTGGTNTAANAIFLGYNASSSGAYTLSGSGVITLTSAVIFVGESGAGTFTQSGGVVAGSSSSELFVGDNGGSSGTYNLNAGSLTAGNEYIGYSNTTGNIALFAQTGGTNTILASRAMYLAYNASSSGTYTLSGAGTLDLSNGSQLVVGDQGTGTFTQSGGAVSGSGATLIVGNQSGSQGTYNLSGGALTTSTEQISTFNSHGFFVQTGGTNTILPSGALTVDCSTSLSGTTYTLSGGSLVLDPGASLLLVAQEGSPFGDFDQSGGSVSGSGATLVVGYGSYADGNEDPGAAYYSLTGTGAIAVSGEEVGYDANGGEYFAQTGGVNTVLTSGSLIIGVNPNSIGIYTLSGSGALVLDNGATLIVGGSGQGTFTQSGGTVSGSGATLIVGNVGKTNDPNPQNGDASGTYDLNGGTMTFQSEQIGALSSGSNPALFTQTGGTNEVTASGNSYVGYNSGAVGTYTLSGTGVIALDSGATLIVGESGTGTFTQSGGVVSATSATLFVGRFGGSSGTYNLSGGRLISQTEYVGAVNQAGNTALIAQTGGTNEIVPSGVLDLGYNPGAIGTYTLSGSGVLMLDSGAGLNLGFFGAGTFNQSGGLVTGTGGYITLGLIGGSSGTYNLSGSGALLVATENVGSSGTGAFVQTGGTNEVTGTGNLYIGNNPSSSGTYALSGTGALQLDSGANLTVGYGGTGTFTQSGGVVSATSATLFVGRFGGSSGTYNLNGGKLISQTEYVGAANHAGDTALFAQTGGTNEIVPSGLLDIGYNPGAVGTYTLGGNGVVQLDSGAGLFIGIFGAGTFTQSGGVVSGPAVSVTLGDIAGSSGTYNLNGGALTVSSEQIGASGTGVFIQTGGTNTVGASIAIKGSYSLNGGSLMTPVSSGFTTQATGTFAMHGNGVETGDMQNYGAFRDGGGAFNGTLENYGATTVSGTQNAETFAGNITNEPGATFTTNNANVTYSGTFTNNGGYISEPSIQNFNALVIGTTGWMAGGAGDVFNVSGNVVNTSTNNTAFNLSASRLVLQGTGTRNFTWTGANLGKTPVGETNNFSIGTFELQSGISLDILDGNQSGALGIYVETLQLDGGLGQIADITGNGTDIFYDFTAAGNAYLNDQTYALVDGGFLIPVPEPGPAPLLLFGAGLLALHFRRRRGLNSARDRLNVIP